MTTPKQFMEWGSFSAFIAGVRCPTVHRKCERFLFSANETLLRNTAKPIWRWVTEGAKRKAATHYREFLTRMKAQWNRTILMLFLKFFFFPFLEFGRLLKKKIPDLSILLWYILIKRNNEEQTQCYLSPVL